MIADRRIAAAERTISKRDGRPAGPEFWTARGDGTVQGPAHGGDRGPAGPLWPRPEAEAEIARRRAMGALVLEFRLEDWSL